MTHEIAPRIAEQHLPNGWREAALQSVADVRFSSVDKLAQPSEQPIRLCNYIDVYKNDYITGDLEFMEASAKQPEIDRFGLNVGDVIITKDSETPDDIGVSAVVDYAAPDLVCGYHLGLIRPNQSNVDSTFLAKQLAYHRIAKYFGRQANGLTRYGLPLSAVLDTPLLLPERGEQETVGALLRLMDKAIMTTEDVIAKLMQVRTGLLHDLLTYGLDDQGKLRDPTAHPEHFKSSSLGYMPREWNVQRLEYMVEILDHMRVPICAEERSTRSGTVPYYGANGLQGWIDGFLFDESLILIAEDGGNFDEYATRPIAYKIAGKSWVNNHAHVLRASNCNVLDFIFLTLEHRDIRRYIAGSTRSKLTQKELRSIEIASPIVGDEQRRIAAAAAMFDLRCVTETTQLAKLKLLKSGLTTDLLTGRVRVTEDLFREEIHA